MMHIDFDTLSYRYPASHLVAGLLEEAFAVAEIGALGRHLRRIIESMGPADYATGLVRTGADVEYHFRFARLEDAEAFGSRFDARRRSKPIPCHQFSIDRQLYQALVASRRQPVAKAETARLPNSFR